MIFDMKICVKSDIHGNLIPYPSEFWEGLENCELLIICGDLIPLEIQRNMPLSRQWFETEFKVWAESLPVEKVIFVAGNHDFWLERNDQDAHELFNSSNKVVYLKNEIYSHISTVDNKVYELFGSPYCHIFGNWAFMIAAKELKNKFKSIPEDIDLLITHDAPYGTSDICLEGWSADGEHKGCPELRDAIIEKQPRYCVHGHLHSVSHNGELLDSTVVYNTSMLNETYNIAYKPLILEI